MRGRQNQHEKRIHKSKKMHAKCRAIQQETSITHKPWVLNLHFQHRDHLLLVAWYPTRWGFHGTTGSEVAVQSNRVRPCCGARAGTRKNSTNLASSTPQRTLCWGGNVRGRVHLVLVLPLMVSPSYACHGRIVHIHDLCQCTGQSTTVATGKSRSGSP